MKHHFGTVEVYTYPLCTQVFVKGVDSVFRGAAGLNVYKLCSTFMSQFSSNPQGLLSRRNYYRRHSGFSLLTPYELSWWRQCWTLTCLPGGLTCNSSRVNESQTGDGCLRMNRMDVTLSASHNIWSGKKTKREPQPDS